MTSVFFSPYDINFNSQILCFEDTASSFYHSEWTFKLSASFLIMDKSYITVLHPGGATEGFYWWWVRVGLLCWLQDSWGMQRVET